MSYTIYGDKGSGAFSAEAALAEAGAPYQLQYVSLKDNEQRKPVFLAINPSGKMPALRLPEGDVITESLAILLTVADHFPNAHLLPPTGPARAQAYRWLAFMASEIYPMVEVSDYPERFAPTGEQAGALRTKHASEFVSVF
jgi:glutathione S-transferase